MGAYSLIGASIAPTLNMVSVDLQPRCVAATRCHLALNHLKADVLNRYVSNNATAGPIDVPDYTCDSMASPTAVGGRRPNGNLRALSNALMQGRFNRSRLQSVLPLALGTYMHSRLQPNDRIVVTKIDTEGFEPRVLESLRPVWHAMDDVVMELQPHAWRHHNISVDTAIATLRDFMTTNAYKVVTLPHAEGARPAATPDLVDPCRLPQRRSASKRRGWKPRTHGLRSAEVYDVDGLIAMVKDVLPRPPGAFYEMLLTKRWSSCAAALSAKAIRSERV